MSETDLQRQIQIELSSNTTRLLRNNVGYAWQGGNFEIRDGKLVSGAARYIAFGLAPGSSDLIGPHSMLVTPAMVGQRIAIFAAVEVKKKARRTPEQVRFVETMQNLGGLAGFARSVEEAREIVTRFER